MLVGQVGQSLAFFAVVMAELAILFVAVSILVSLAQQYVSEQKIRKALTRRWVLGTYSARLSAR